MVKSLIICEGKNDRDFLKRLLEHLKIANIEIQIFSNKSSIFKREKYENISQELGTIYKNLLIVFDSDFEKDNDKYGGFENSKREIETLISDLNLENADYYIVCDPETKNGYLESLILSTIPEDKKECIENFLYCSNFKDKEKDKAIWNQIYKLGYPNSPYDFAHKNFDDLKKKLRSLEPVSKVK